MSEPVAPLTLKGKARAGGGVPSARGGGRLGSAVRDADGGPRHRVAAARAMRSPQAVHDHSCQLFTVLGSAGVGKSRLAAEFLARCRRAACSRAAACRTARASPTGRWWRSSSSSVRCRTGTQRGRCGRCWARPTSWRRPRRSPGGFASCSNSRRRPQPLVCVFDDLHWAEETLLDLVEHVADLARDAPILLLCMARPDLLERRQSWGGGKWNATTVLLEPLDAAESAELIGKLGRSPDELSGADRPGRRGQPALPRGDARPRPRRHDGKVDVPPTIQALLAARLDQLDPAERAVLERGSVEGRVFHRGAVAGARDEATETSTGGSSR